MERSELTQQEAAERVFCGGLSRKIRVLVQKQLQDFCIVMWGLDLGMCTRGGDTRALLASLRIVDGRQHLMAAG